MAKPRSMPGGPTTDALTQGYSLDFTRAVDGRPAPRTSPSFPFLYAFDRKRWQVYPTPDQVERLGLSVEPMVVPLLIPLKLVKGLQNVATKYNRLGDPIGLDIAGLLLDQQRRGRIVIPHARGPKQGDGSSTYCCKVRGRPTYLDSWTLPIPGSRETRTDHAAKALWLRQLIVDGIVPDIELHELESYDRKLQRATDRMRDRYARMPSAGAAIDRWAALRDVVRAALQARRKSSEPIDTEAAKLPKLFSDDVLVEEP